MLATAMRVSVHSLSCGRNQLCRHLTKPIA